MTVTDRTGVARFQCTTLLTRVAPLVLCLCLASCSHKGETPSGPVIRHLRLEGPDQVSKGTIKKRIATAATGWWWPFATKQYFDPVTWQSDLRRIERVYEAHGFYQAEIVSDEVKAVEGGVDLKAVVSEGKPTRVESFEVKGLESLNGAERDLVLEDLGLSKGSVFLEGRWEAAKEHIKERLRDLGFAEVELNARALVDVKTQKASLLMVARLGQRYRFGDIDIRLGPHGRLAPVWVWEQVRLAIPEGETFSDEALMEAQRRVFGMGLFAMAKVTAGTPDQSTARMPIVVEAREAPFRMLRTGAGVRIDQIRNEARLILEWSHRNFFGGMRKLTVRTEAGWAFIPNTYAVVRNQIASGPLRNGPIARLGLQFEQPRFLGRPSFTERTTLDLEKSLEQSYDALGGRVGTGVAWQPRSSLTIFPSYNIQAYWLNGPATASATAAPLTLGCANQNQGNNCFILLSYLEQMITWDRRDAPLEARNGFFASLSLQEGGGPLRGDFTYLRVLPDVRGYISFGDHDQLTFASRLRVGELLPTSGRQSAVVTRFFGGGGVSMRGFSDRRLSPLLLAPAPGQVQAGADPIMLTLPIGGDGMIDGSFEARYQLTERLVLAAFVDYGQVTQGRIGPDDVTTLLWAVGLGLRYRTPIGPIRLDFARRLRRGRPPPLLSVESGSVTSVPYWVDDSCFGFGGSDPDPAMMLSTAVKDNLCVFHIAIGEAF
ncbi:MAG: BamA/TamA family outer membrane protein [Deltaproteobacteria bacterium]|nr:BamA/TamA family outer membrane protein [Deltaproteobacteria bacterium]